jgi:hypothetical protein
MFTLQIEYPDNTNSYIYEFLQRGRNCAPKNIIGIIFSSPLLMSRPNILPLFKEGNS